MVYTAEHYVADVIAGWAYAAGVYLLVDWVTHRWSERDRGRRVSGVEPESSTRINGVARSA